MSECQGVKGGVATVKDEQSVTYVGVRLNIASWWKRVVVPAECFRVEASGDWRRTSAYSAGTTLSIYASRSYLYLIRAMGKMAAQARLILTRHIVIDTGGHSNPFIATNGIHRWYTIASLSGF